MPNLSNRILAAVADTLNTLATFAICFSIISADVCLRMILLLLRT